MMPERLSIILAGGGTTGHISPLVATAEALRATLAGDAAITCVGTSKGLETTVVPAAGLELRLIPAVPLPRKLTPDLLKVPFRLFGAARQAGAIIAGASVVAGFGGYVSLPVYLAAWRRHVPFVIHEQNARPGLANKLMAGRATAVLTSFPGTPLPHARLTGLPVRAAVAELAGRGRRTLSGPAREAYGLPVQGPVLLASGGSQGARSINLAVAGARDALLAAGVSVLHVWGGANLPADAAVLDGAGGARYVPLRYVDDMAQAYAAADLMLARSGAATVAETATLGLPCLFVPFPHGNGEQSLNAAPLVEAGACEVIGDADLTPERLTAAVLPLFQDEERLAAMGQAAQSVMKPGAAERVAQAILTAAEAR